MDQRHFIQASLLLITATVGISRASADTIPPDYVEQCTLEKQQLPGKSCISCRASHLDPTACQDQYVSQGYTKICKTASPSAWTEVWCKTDADSGVGGATIDNPDLSTDVGCNCRMSGREKESIPGGALGVAAIAWIGLLRRRRAA